MKQARPLLIALAVVAVVAAIWSYVLLHDPARQTLDQRVQAVASQLKCPVCQGESVASSPATLAQQMRGVIRRQLQAGRSEQQVIQYFQNSYGASIVWSPPWQGFTLLAWLVPMLLLGVGALLLLSVLRGWRRAAAPAEVELAQVDEAELAAYRAELERELAEDDPTFIPQSGLEAR
jgi:cytochrome c-type biogenesis protein CcmH